MMAGSKWDAVLETLNKSLNHNLRTISRENYVEFCLNNKETRKAAEDYLQDFINYKKSNGKNSIHSALKKNEGNLKYKERKFEESLELYTESIFYADKNDECLPLAYSNRSLVLEAMGHLKESIQDIDLALGTGYPENKSGKLIVRKARCFARLGDVNKAMEILRNALQKPSVGESLHAIKKELDTLKNMKNDRVSNFFEYQLPEVAGGENENFASASKYLSVVYNKSKGRHVIATDDIEIGDVLFVEKPFAFVLFDGFCHRCCEKTIAPVPCWNCTDVTYCSPECRDDFWKSIHSFECGFSKLFKSIGIAHLSLRIILTASSSYESFKKLLEGVTEFSHEDGIVTLKSNGYESVFNLVTNIEKYEASDLIQYVMTALLLSLYLKNHTNYFSRSAGDEDLKLITSIIWRHIMQLICNGHAITDTFLRGSEGYGIVDETEERCGTAIYPSASMMNHSCEPSIIYSFYKNTLIARAAKAIKKTEEVFNCYGPHARRMKRTDRQEILSKQYFFKCQCPPCLQAFDIQDVFTALKCSNCKGPSIPKEENSESVICLNCDQVFEITVDVKQKQNLIYSLIEEGESLLDNDVNSALKKFLKSWWLGREIFYKFHKDLSYGADEVAKCFATLKDYRKCILFLKCCVLSVEKRFGSFSIELANELKKLGDASTNYSLECKGNEARSVAREGIRCYQKAHDIIKMFYGPIHRDLEEISANKEVLEAFLKNL